MAAELEKYIDQLVNVITCDGRNILGVLRGFDQTLNLILDDSHERLLSPIDPPQRIDLGLYIVRGDNIAIVGEMDELKDKTMKIEEKKADPKAPKRPSAAETATPPPQPTQPGETNMALDSFEKVMAAMDEELGKVKRAKHPPKPASSSTTTSVSSKLPPKAKTKPSSSNLDPLPKLPTEADLDDLSEDDLLAMDRELKAALKGAGLNSDDEDDGEMDVEEAKDLEGEDRREYRMMRDFLESYRSQGGGSGVVGNLFGRLGEGK